MKTKQPKIDSNRKRAKLSDFIARGTTTYSVEIDLIRNESIIHWIVLLTQELKDAMAAANYLAESFNAAAADWFDGNVITNDQLLKVSVLKYSRGTLLDFVYDVQPVNAFCLPEDDDQV